MIEEAVPFPISYVRGDATAPVGGGPKVIAHVCNDVHAWGRGFVLAISRRWREPEKEYRAWANGRLLQPFELGEVQFVKVTEEITVASMLAQRGLMRRREQPAIRYDALERCLADLATFAVTEKASVHMPRIGCGLAGGNWNEVEPRICDALSRRGVPVTIYDLPHD